MSKVYKLSEKGTVQYWHLFFHLPMCKTGTNSDPNSTSSTTGTFSPWTGTGSTAEASMENVSMDGFIQPLEPESSKRLSAMVSPKPIMIRMKKKRPLPKLKRNVPNKEGIHLGGERTIPDICPRNYGLRGPSTGPEQQTQGNSFRWLQTPIEMMGQLPVGKEQKPVLHLF